MKDKNKRTLGFILLLIGIFLLLMGPVFNQFWVPNISPFDFDDYIHFEHFRPFVGHFFIMPWRFFGVFNILFLILWIVMTIWVFRDAESRGMNGFLWGLLVLVGHIIGLIVYLIVRKEGAPAAIRSAPKNKCPNCGSLVEERFVVCPYCETKLLYKCQNCEKVTRADWKVCPYCGTEL